MEVLNAVEAFFKVTYLASDLGTSAGMIHSFAAPPPSSSNLLEELFKGWTGYLADGVEASAGLIIAFAAIQATIRAIILFLRKPKTEFGSQEPQTENIRLRFGRWLALALEFELAADILRTAIAPTWAEIGQLAAIAAIRTALNYFLQQEIDRATKRQTGTILQPPPQPSTPEIGEMTGRRAG